MNNKKIAQTTIVVTIVLIISKLSGFLRDVALAYAYGTSEKSDAFVLSTSAIGVLTVLFTCVAIAYMPIYKGLSVISGNKQRHFADTSYTVLTVLAISISIIGVLGANFVVYTLAPGFTESAHQLAVGTTRVMMIMIPFSYLASISGQHLRGESCFLVPAAIAIPSNLILIFAFLFISPVYDIQGVAWANVFGFFVQVAILFALLYKIGYRYTFSFDLKNEGLRRICILTLPILLGNAIQTINTVVDRVLASGLAEGSMAALNFSNKLSLFIIGLITLGAGNVCYTKMSELGAALDYQGLKLFLRSVVNILNLIVVPATVGLVVLAQPVVATVFQYGAFDASSAQMTATALFFYAFGLVGFALRDMITRAFYSIHDSKTPMWNGAIAVVINIVGNILLVRIMGLAGLALATSISAVVGTILLFLSLRKKLGALGAREMIAVFLKTCFAAGVMGAVVYRLYPLLLSWTGIVPLALLLDISVGIIVYGMMVLCLKIKEVEAVKAYVKRI